MNEFRFVVRLFFSCVRIFHCCIRFMVFSQATPQTLTDINRSKHEFSIDLEFMCVCVCVQYDSNIITHLSICFLFFVSRFALSHSHFVGEVRLAFFKEKSISFCMRMFILFSSPSRNSFLLRMRFIYFRPLIPGRQQRFAPFTRRLHHIHSIRIPFCAN